MSGAGIVLALGELVAAPSPSDGEEFNSVTVSPGLPGFFAMFVLAVAVVLLAVDMTRRTRRVQARARVQERMAAEEEAAAQERATGADDEARIGGDTGGGGSGDAVGGGSGDAEVEDPAEESSLEETPIDGTSNAPHPGETAPEEDGPSGDDRR